MPKISEESNSNSDQKFTSTGWSFADLHGSMLAWVILALSAIITIAAWRISYDSVQKAAENRFAFKTHDVRSAIEKRMHEQEAALWGGVGLFDASETVTRQGWAKYVRSLRLDKYLPGLQGYGYAEFVRHKDKLNHIDRVRSEGFPDFNIRPEGVRSHYSSIIYLEPFRDRNLRAFGYDMFSEPTRREAMERARDTGEAAVSGMVTLVQETESDIQRGFLMYLPVYHKGMPTATIGERRVALKGHVYSPFRIKDLMQGILGKGEAEIGFRIYDGVKAAQNNLLYDSAEGTSDLEMAYNLQTATSALNIGGHPWTLQFRATPGFVPPADKNQPMIVAAGGILIDILLFLTISSLSNQRRRAMSLANRMTGELRQAKEAAEQSADNEIVLRTVTQEANAKLKAANEGLLKFTSIVAHDLRAPLMRIESFVEILEEEYQDRLDEEGIDIVARIGRGSSRMRLMLDSLHNYTKCRDVSIAGKTANLASVFKSAIDTLGVQTEDVVIALDIDETFRAKGDAVLLEHVVLNLVSNSIKFKSDEPPMISIAARACDDWYEIAIEDNGIGIEPKYAKHVFDMFARLHNEDEYDGTGIGLAVCQSIISDHGGEIFVDTDHTGGTRIVIRLQRDNASGQRESRKQAA